MAKHNPPTSQPGSPYNQSGGGGGGGGIINLISDRPGGVITVGGNGGSGGPGAIGGAVLATMQAAQAEAKSVPLWEDGFYMFRLMLAIRDTFAFHLLPRSLRDEINKVVNAREML